MSNVGGGGGGGGGGGEHGDEFVSSGSDYAERCNK